MKQAYTQYSTMLARYSKGMGMSIHEFLSRIDSNDPMCNRVVYFTPLDKSVLHAEHDVLSGKGHHIYLNNKGFCDWLVSQSVPSSDEALGYLYEQISKGMPSVFHFPTSSGLHSFLLVSHRNYLPPEELNNLEAPYICLATGGITVPSNYNSRLANGLALYLNCFPECLACGVPEDLKHPSHHNHALSYTIRLSTKVRADNGTHTSPCGHFRRGHFRILSSDWYTKKRHQVVFVHETFVNGKAHTVLSPEEVDSLSSSSASIA